MPFLAFFNTAAGRTVTSMAAACPNADLPAANGDAGFGQSDSFVFIERIEAKDVKPELERQQQRRAVNRATAAETMRCWVVRILWGMLAKTQSNPLKGNRFFKVLAEWESANITSIYAGLCRAMSIITSLVQ